MKTLVVVDMQRDFMPGGVLPVPNANEIIPMINALFLYCEHAVATVDWHPEHHVSFGQATRWPVHCVQHSEGAQFAKGLTIEKINAIFKKGTDPNVDSYSAFFDQMRHPSTGLADYLREHKLQDLYFVGVATDYCVLYSVLDALELGFRVTVIRDACRAINPGDEEKAITKMKTKGAKIAISKDFIPAM
jgi:nicotinamidase/pyrazinamidase